MYLGDGQIIENPHFRPEIIKKVYELLKTERGQQIKMGAIKSRYSKTVRASYLSFGCPYCDAIFGDHYYFDEICNIEYGYVKTIDFNTTLSTSLEKEDIPHWCYSPNRNFCGGTARTERK